MHRMTIQLLALAVGTLSILLQACNTAYVPNTVNVPLMRNANEARIYADPKINVQASYAITNEIGVMASAHIVTERTNDSNAAVIQRGSGSQYEAGIGYQKMLMQNVITSGDLVGEVYVGGGFGSLRFDNVADNKSYEVSATKIFLQPSLGFSHQYIEVAFTPRVVALMYGEPTTQYTDAELDIKELPNRSMPMHWFIEPAITVRGGIQEVKLQFQIGQSFQLSSTALAHEKLILVVGASFNLGRNSPRN